MIKVAIVGSKTIDNIQIIENIWKQIKLPLEDILIISRGLDGADTIAEEFANKYDLEYEKMIPNWKKYDKSAPSKNNHNIIKYCDFCIVLWDGLSKDNEWFIELCKNYMKRIYIWNNAPGHRILHTYKYENTKLDIF